MTGETTDALARLYLSGGDCPLCFGALAAVDRVAGLVIYACEDGCDREDDEERETAAPSEKL